mmetsp:Transcript_11363/g.28692  ORF Transcript_11363/g.28692 Transcript_11363/m.28692 type:complete len:308 (+) Transcript_11363:3-926(+)
MDAASARHQIVQHMVGATQATAQLTEAATMDDLLPAMEETVSEEEEPSAATASGSGRQAMLLLVQLPENATGPVNSAGMQTSITSKANDVRLPRPQTLSMAEIQSTGSIAGASATPERMQLSTSSRASQSVSGMRRHTRDQSMPAAWPTDDVTSATVDASAATDMGTAVAGRPREVASATTGVQASLETPRYHPEEVRPGNGVSPEVCPVSGCIGTSQARATQDANRSATMAQVTVPQRPIIACSMLTADMSVGTLAAHLLEEPTVATATGLGVGATEASCQTERVSVVKEGWLVNRTRPQVEAVGC